MPGKPSRRAQKRRKNARGEQVLPRTYDGVTDRMIYTRDKWMCRMPECLCPDGRAMDPRLEGTCASDWSPSIDHAIPLSQGGPDTANNKRAAHRACNQEAARRRRREQREPDPMPIASRIDPRQLEQLNGGQDERTP